MKLCTLSWEPAHSPELFSFNERGLGTEMNAPLSDDRSIEADDGLPSLKDENGGTVTPVLFIA